MKEPLDPSDPAMLVRRLRIALAGIEETLYIVVGLLLLAAAVLVVVGTVTGLIGAVKSHESAVGIGVVLLDHVLLTLIVVELLHTLRLALIRGAIVVEPFLYVGLIAAVRRILIVTAQLEGVAKGGRPLTNELLELGLLGVLTLALAVAVYLVRSSDRLPTGSGGESPAMAEL